MLIYHIVNCNETKLKGTQTWDGVTLGLLDDVLLLLGRCPLGLLEAVQGPGEVIVKPITLKCRKWTLLVALYDKWIFGLRSRDRIHVQARIFLQNASLKSIYSVPLYIVAALLYFFWHKSVRWCLRRQSITLCFEFFWAYRTNWKGSHWKRLGIS